MTCIKPSLVICHNSMHSKKQTMNVNPLLTNLFPAFYNYSARFPENHPSKILERQLANQELDRKYDFLKDLNMSFFLKDTAADFYILYCKFHDLGKFT